MASKDLVKGYCKESKCEYDVYTKEKMDELLEEISTGMVGDEYSSSSTYSKGDLTIYNNTLYVCNTDITTAEEWNASHWTETSLSNELKNKQNALTFDSTPTSNSTNPVTSGGIKTLFDNVDELINTINTALSGKMNSNKFAILTGSITGTGGGSTDVDYPSGFTKDNCIVVGAMINNYGGSSYAFGTGLSNATNPNVRLKNDKVGISIFTDSTSELTYGYRIALMRID